MQPFLLVALLASLAASPSETRRVATVDFRLAQQLAASTSLQSPGVKVWVNLSSKVYHCPGTRYYGATKRGEFMTEAEAENAGSRPAYGLRCGAEGSISTRQTLSASATPSRLSIASLKDVASTTADATVWVNRKSHVYHCRGTRYYGTTKSGEFMTESDAVASGNRPAYGRPCS